MKKNSTGIALLVAIVAIIVLFVFKPFLLHPNGFMFSKSGEAQKSYYNFSYQLKYGSGMMNQGMNYPYGEQVQMDNAHPFHLWFFRMVDNIIPVSTHGVALINLSLLLSLFLSLPFLFLILRRYKLPVWYSVVIAIVTVFLSPQLIYFKGHLELGYLLFIPMWWYFLLKFRDGKKAWLWGALLVNSGFLAGFISQWYLAIYFLFLVGVAFSDLWINRKNIAGQLKPAINLFLMAVVPVLVVRLALWSSDPFIDRPANPFGFYEYNANLFSIFLPFDSVAQLISRYNYSLLNIQPDGHSNIGVPAIIVAVVIVSLILYRFYTRKKISALFTNRDFNPFLLTSVLLLLFAMNFPFNCGLGFLLKVFPGLKLFVAPGRLAWVFYYVFMVYASIEIYQYFEKLRSEGRKKRSVWVMTILLLLWVYDATANVVNSWGKIQNNNDRFESDGREFMKRFDTMGKSADDFQAILSLPFANAASDKMEFDRGTVALTEAMKLSYHSGLPIIESLSPRQSVSQSLSAIQLLADSCIRKTRLSDMNDKPILLLTMNDPLPDNEKWLKQQADSLWGDQWLTLSEVSPSILDMAYEKWLFWANELKSQLTGSETLKADTSLSAVYHLDFDKDKSPFCFTGDGALYQKKGKVEVFNEDFDAKGMTGEYELSFWLCFDTRSAEMPKAVLNEIDRYDFPINPVILNTLAENNVYGNWVRIDQRVMLTPGMKYQLMVEGKYISIDNLLMKPVGCNVYVKTSEGKELMNNFIME